MDADLRSNPDEVLRVLSGQWTSLPGGSEPNSQTGNVGQNYRNALTRYRSQIGQPAQPPPGQAIATPGPQASLNPVNGRVQVSVDITGAPRGTTARVAASGSGVQTRPVRIATAMPGMGIV